MTMKESLPAGCLLQMLTEQVRFVLGNKEPILCTLCFSFLMFLFYSCCCILFYLFNSILFCCPINAVFNSILFNSTLFCCSLFTTACLPLCDPMDCSPPGCSVPGILQARRLEWVVISFTRGSSRPRDRTHVPCIGRAILDRCTTCAV